MADISKSPSAERDWKKIGGNMAKRLSKSAVNWAAFAERVPPNQVEAYRALKAKSDGFVSQYVFI